MGSNLICIAICRMVEMHVGYKQRGIKILYYVFVIVVAMGVMNRVVYRAQCLVVGVTPNRDAGVGSIPTYSTKIDI